MDAQDTQMNSQFGMNQDAGARETQATGLQAQGDAFDVLRSSVTGVLESVVREYEPQIAEFTQNFAHQAVDKGVELAQTAVTRVKQQSWARLAIAGALGVGLVAVLAYEAEKSPAATASRRRTQH